MIEIDKHNLSPSTVNALRRLAAFANPEYYRAVAAHQYVGKTPRIISCGVNSPESISLPRGCQEPLRTMAFEQGLHIRQEDIRESRRAIRAIPLSGKSAAVKYFARVLVPRYTKFRLSERETETTKTFAALLGVLCADADRNHLIVDDVLQLVARGRSPLVLTRRIKHAQLAALAAKRDDEACVVVATGTIWAKASTTAASTCFCWRRRLVGRASLCNMPGACTASTRAKPMYLSMTMLTLRCPCLTRCIASA